MTSTRIPAGITIDNIFECRRKKKRKKKAVHISYQNTNTFAKCDAEGRPQPEENTTLIQI